MPPRWDLSPIFPSLDSPAFLEATERLRVGADGLGALLDELSPYRPASPLDGATADAFEDAVGRYETLLEVGWTVETYVMALVDTGADDRAARAAESVVAGSITHVRILRRRIAAWLASLDLDALIERSPVAQDRGLALRRLHEQASHAMPIELEALAGELHPLAGAGWAKLRAQVIASIRIEVDGEGSAEPVPLSSLRAAATNPDRAIRHRVHRAEVRAYEAQSVPLAAALNGVVGERSILARRRGWATPLDESLASQGIDRAILEALVAATRAALPRLRRHLDVKARALGVERLAWFDLTAPIGGLRAWTFDEAAELVTAAFSRFSPALGELADRAFRERWIDAEPWAGKQGGGLCYMLPNGRSVIRVEFHGGYDGVRMLAHELGHAYHGAVLAQVGRPLLQIDSAPAPLMETAGKLCEEVVRQEATDRARRAGDRDGELALLDGFLTGVRRSVVDALTNFLFEERIFALRAERALSANEINALMNETRLDVDGDVLDPASPYPWAWAAQPHLYLDGQAFYNLPYLFGQLLALGRYARSRVEPDGFAGRFDAFLADVGRLPTDEIGRSFGIDLASTAFWAEGLAEIGREIDRYEVLVGGG